MIVHITATYPPRLGGLEKVVEVLAKTESSQGIDTCVITSTQGGARAGVTADTFKVTRLRSFMFANTTFMPKLFFKALRIKKTDFVHLHVAQAFTPEIVWLASKIKRFPYLAHLHLDVPASGWAGFLLGVYKPLILGRVLRSAKYVIVFTKDQQIAVHDSYKVALDRIKIIPNGVESSFYHEKPRVLHKKPHLLFVGRLSSQKNIPQFLQALEGISNLFQTTLVGEGELEDKLQAEASALRLANVQFVGRADGAMLRNYYLRGDIFVLPSEREGMPLVLLEAMAMGLPIVATDVTGNRDVVHDGKNGLLVPYNDVAALRATLVKLSTDQKLYAKLNKSAYTTAKQYSWDKIANEFMTLYGLDI